MARSLGLTAYRALTRRREALTAAPDVARPVGELVWIHAGEAGSLIAVEDLARRICATRGDVSVLITVPGTDPVPVLREQPEQVLIAQHAPSEHPEAVTAFLDHWAPDLGVWVWGGLRPNLILDAADRDCPLMLIDADAKGYDGRRDRWLPELTRKLLGTFSHVFARSAAGQKRLAQLGLAPRKIEVTSPLLAGGQALPCDDSDLSDLSESLGGRPVWFAARVEPDEVQIVLSAHRQALRLSHRLLLILGPAESDQLLPTADQVAEQGLDVIFWDDGEEPDDATQVMLTADPADRGLFYRVAPVSFLGSSLVPDKGGCDPLEAAALGSAVLYGPKVRSFLPSYSRLAAAGAARIVNDAPALGTAVSRLIAPDQAATMAHAGWDVISQGADLTDKVVALVQTMLDERAGNT
ncbi:3-deoxy-D-manno-octulosonic acid transferase [Sulfitobacter aestuariivivens]|uniref:3-deoxy-D-manno-octulosonic acid transferase n=1 Tax=Sulfitobacter aestuariivivens TaxID=2766981 RepID=A0A927D8E5_9RHOB|nr:glycosyltransferase N-terminal domain-containing protein [Sulfitobacter aestuariivivens]MBD3665654.1 3-deoxy-D-manno-octulosonic acid transferase [Sulfitobacter aestuariivivens]